MRWFDRLRRRRGEDSAAATGEAGKDAVAESAESAEADAAPRRGVSGSRLVGLLAAVAVVSLLIGVGVMQFIVSPADLAARTAPPDAGPVAAKVEEKRIENTVLTRGEITYADAVKVTIDVGGAEGRPVVTGHVPEVGAVLNIGSVALELAGRPVVVLPGELPAYRNLSIGMRGPDVAQLKHALAALGYGVGDLASDAYDWDTATAVGALYEQLGYSAPSRGTGDGASLKAAERAVRDANVQLAERQAALDSAVAAEVPNVNAEIAARNAAADSLSDARQALAEAQEAALPSLPSSEVLFLGGLPRRVDEVTVKRGDVLAGSPMVVSGATLAIVGTVSQQDAELLKEGATANYSGPDGVDRVATLTKIEESKPAPGGGEGSGGGGQAGNAGQSGQGTSKRMSLRFDPGALTPEEIESLRGNNVRLKIPVAATDGEVLAVPIAAISAGSGGGDRVELITGDISGKDTPTETVEVKVGLAADGFAEISSQDSRVKAGAKVVIGR